MNLSKRSTLVLAAACLLGVNVVNAEVKIDFSNNDYFGNNDLSQNFALVGNTTVSATGGIVNFVAATPTDPANMPSNTLALDYDGAGVRQSGNQDDEVTLNGTESLIVSFQNAATVTSVEFLDLFAQGTPAISGSTGAESIDVVFYLNGSIVGTETFIGTDPNPFNASTPGQNGYLFGALDIPIRADKLVFKMNANSLRDDATADAAVAAITVVPIPAAAWLFGSALLGIAGIGYRRKAGKA